MDVRGKLEKVAKERGASVETVIRAEVERTGSVLGAAGALGVAPNAVVNWLRSNGFKAIRVVKATIIKGAQ